MRIELPAALPTATAWRRPDQSLTLTLGADWGAIAAPPPDEAAPLALWHVDLGAVDHRGLVFTLAPPTAR